MRNSTEASLITQLRQLQQSGLLCNGNYPTVNLSGCASIALREFIDVYICQLRASQSINYQHLLSLLRILNAQRTLLTAHDTFIWQEYRKLNLGVPGTSHQLVGLAKALIKGGFYP